MQFVYNLDEKRIYSATYVLLNRFLNILVTKHIGLHLEVIPEECRYLVKTYFSHACYTATTPSQDCYQRFEFGRRYFAERIARASVYR